MNEFVARNGLIALDSSSISGPFVVTGSTSILGQLYVNNGGAIGQVIQAVNHVGGTSYIYLQAGGSDSYISSTGTNSFSILNSTRIGLGSSLADTPWVGMTSSGTYIGFNSHISPSARLHIKGATSGSALTLLTQNSNNSSSFAVRDDGNIGIGTTTPGYKLQVAGTIYADRIFVPNAIGDYGLMVGTTSRYSYTPLTVDGSNWSALATGVFQHNRSSTTYTGGYDQPLLSLSNYNTSANTWNIIEFGKRADTAEAIAAIGVQYKDGSNSDMAFFTEGGGAFNEKVRLLANGNFGIGTNSATAKLDVRGNTFLSGSVTGSDMLIRGSGNTSGTNALTVLNSAGSALMSTRNDGLVTLNNDTVVGNRLHIENGITFNYGGGNFNRTILSNAGSNVTFRLPSNPAIYNFTNWNSSSTAITIFSIGDSAVYSLPNVGIGTTSPTFRLDINGSFRSSGSITATSGSDYFDISHDLTQPAQTGSQIYEVNITPTLRYTAPNQTQTALRVAATFTGSTALSSSQSNIIADFGSTSAGSQFLVNDVTSGSIYMVNDVSGLPIIEANSNWDVMIYDYPNVVLRKTGSAIIISGSLTIASGSNNDLYMYGHKMFSVGAFQSDQTQSGSANVSQSITYNTTDYSQGVSVVSGSRLTVANAGVYNIQFSVQVDRIAGSGVDTIHIWLKKNGTNVTNSSGTITISGNASQAKTVSSWNYVVDSAANDYYELCWQTTDTNIQLINVVATGNIPGTPSVIVTVTQVR
jgi:hypothetical protein